MEELISIIMPIYNTAQYLERSIKSIIEQTYTNLEIICINDGSTDNSLEILEKYKNKDARIKIINKENAGVSAARNDGIQLAKGEYICFIDSDDEMELNAIETLYQKMKENDVDVVRGNYKLHNSESKVLLPTDIINKRFASNQIKNNVIPKLISGEISCLVYLLLVKKEKIRLFDENIGIMEDKIFYIDLLLNVESAYFSDCIIYNYYLNENSKDRFRKYNKRNLEESIQVYKKIQAKLIEYKVYTETIKQDLATTHLKIIIRYLKSLHDNSESKEISETEIKTVIMKDEVKEMLKYANINNFPEELKNFMVMKIISM